MTFLRSSHCSRLWLHFLILQLLSFTEFRSFHDFSLKGWNHQADSQDQGTEDSNIAGIDAKRNHGPNQKLVGDRSDRNTETSALSK